ncbi:MAG TPA: methyltransferase domain-containing protein [Bryobacteraceae bacterium]|nr:methyltransferase domain-containing protein [Bryobacteraceae bacterium]
MDEILRNLRPGARVLDVGSLTGSFPTDRCPGALVARVDLEAPAPGTCEGFVQADAAHLPFPDRCFDAVIANHSLEHIHGLPEALAEIGRVIRPEGSLYVAVPDASTFSDWLFRWVYQGESGHINPFRSREALAAEITKFTSLKLAGGRDLYSSFEYLNRYYFPRGTPWRLRLVGNGNRRCIVALSYLARLFDHVFHTRASAYGWALYLGNIGETIQSSAWSNVCVGCGSGAPAAWLISLNIVYRRFLFLRAYRCPSCNSANLFTADD